LTLTVLFDRSGEVRRIGRRFQEMDGFHQAVEGVQRHQHGIRRVAPGNDRVIGVIDT
jgi:hypothetical protein